MLLDMALALLDVETEEVFDFVEGRYWGFFAENTILNRLPI